MVSLFSDRPICRVTGPGLLGLRFPNKELHGKTNANRRQGSMLVWAIAFNFLAWSDTVITIFIDLKAKSLCYILNYRHTEYIH